MSQDPFERAVQRIEDQQRIEDTDRQQRRQQRLRRGFRIHAAVFASTQLLLVATWAIVAATADFWLPWFVFPLLGWGIGLAAHLFAIRSPSTT